MNPQPSPSTPTPEAPARTEDWRRSFETELERRIVPRPGAPEVLFDAMRYAVLSGGKRMRPLLVYAAAEALGLVPESVHGIACAVETIHAYSLIHDDLPSMDDDDLRRGRPTCHRAFGESTAILAGDALQALAFEILASDKRLAERPAAQARLIADIASACGAAGMAGGQVLDLAAVDQAIDRAQLETMHRLKTGALIRVSATAPAVFASARPSLRAKLDRYGELVGLAFQIHDDILDVTASATQTGKPAQADAARNKPTFPSVLGLEASRARAAELVTEALGALDGLPGDTTVLIWLAGYAIERER